MSSEPIDSTIKALARENPLLANTLKKWKPLILKTVRTAAKIANAPCEDVCQDLLEYIFSMVAVYPVPLYRFRGQNWEIAHRSGRLVCLKPVRLQKVKREQVWTSFDLVEPVRKATFSAMVYRKIVQFPSNVAVKKYTKKNGYNKTRVTRVVKKRTGQITTTEKRKVVIAKAQYNIVSLDGISDKSMSLKLPPAAIRLESILTDLSPLSQKMVQNLCSPDGKQKRSGLSALQRKVAQVEIKRALRSFEYPEGLSPVYFRASNMRRA